MNVAAAYLAREWERLDLRRVGAPSRLCWIAVTPRFRASAHVVFLAFADGGMEPVLVAKVSRLPGRSPTLDHEAAILRAVHAARGGGFASVPRLVAADLVADTHLLVESGLPGRTLDAPMVRRRPHACAAALLAWIVELHTATAAVPQLPTDAFDRLVTHPLRTCEQCLPATSATDALIARTRELTAPLRALPLPLVLTHGDLGAPNILVTEGHRLGVVDWELAEAASLPAQDLFFALAFVASARAGARRTADHLAAFHDAFFGDDAWALPYVQRYAAALRLPPEALRPLFVACWSRYVAARASRLLDPGAERLDDTTAAWLVQDRYFALWHHAVRHADALRLPR